MLSIRTRRRSPLRRTAIAATVVAVGLLWALAAANADGKSRYADIRVVTSGGKTLADYRQFGDDVRFRASRKADCFGEANPSSNGRHRLRDPKALGTLVEASGHSAALRPLLITDAFKEEFKSFGVCGIGGRAASGSSYWYLAVNGAGATAGPNQIPVRNGDRHLWYLTSGAEKNFPSELKLTVPPRVKPGSEFTARVARLLPDGSREPAAGVRVSRADDPADARGRTSLTLGDVEGARLKATGGPDDVPSAAESVCVSRQLGRCPAVRGLRIFGSDGPDRIRATRGPDRINCGPGRDIVVVRRKTRRDDRIADNCERVRTIRR